MAKIEPLERLVKDIKFLKDQIEEIKIDVKEVHDDLHIVRPEYIRKLKKIEKGKFHTFSNIKELKRKIENV